MAVSSGNITIGISATDNIPVSASVLNAYSRPTAQSIANAFANGTGIGLATKIAGDSYTLTAAPQSINLTTLVCTDGATGFSAVRAVIVFNPSTDATHIVKYGDDGVGTNLFLGALLGTAPQYAINAGSAYIDQSWLGATGYAVSGSNANVRLDPGANTVTVVLVVIGN